MKYTLCLIVGLLLLFGCAEEEYRVRELTNMYNDTLWTVERLNDYNFWQRISQHKTKHEAVKSLDSIRAELEEKAKREFK